MAEVHKRQLADRLACYRIGVDWKSTDVNATTLEQTAVHELLHVFFFELIELAKDPATHPDTLTSAERGYPNGGGCFHDTAIWIRRAEAPRTASEVKATVAV